MSMDESLQFSGKSMTLENAQNCGQIRSALERQDVLITMFIFGNHYQIFSGGGCWLSKTKQQTPANDKK